MKKIYRSIGFLTAMLFTDMAYSQSRLALYGIVDTGIAYLRNSSEKPYQFQMAGSGNVAGTRWGVNGIEDLGGGLAAVFQLENGFNAATGTLNQAGREFGRQAFVGLSSTRYGTITLGRQYDPMVFLLQPLTGDGYFGGVFVPPGDVDNTGNSVRFNNAVKWISPKWGGVLQAHAMYSLGGIAASMASGRAMSGALQYADGPLTLAVGYIHIDYGRTLANGVRTPTGSADSIFSSPINRAYSSARNFDTARISGQYVIGQITFATGYSFSEYKPDGFSNFSKEEKYHNAYGFALWTIHPTILLAMGYDYLKSAGDTSAAYHQLSLAAAYLLSNTTKVYVVSGYNHAAGTMRSPSGITSAQAVLGSFGIGSGVNNQEMVIVGLMHKF